MTMTTPLLTATQTTPLSFGQLSAPAEQSLTNADKNYDELYEGCIRARNELLQTANEYRRRAKQAPIDEITTQNWNELDQGVQEACRDLQAREAEDRKPASTSVGRVKKAFRSFCRHAGAGQTLISLLPSDMFGFSSVLCAGFKTVFSAMHQAALYRDTIFRALEELPRVLEDSSELCKLNMFGQDENLHRRCSGLFAAVFDALRHILQWFVRNSFGRYIDFVLSDDAEVIKGLGLITLHYNSNSDQHQVRRRPDRILSETHRADGRCPAEITAVLATSKKAFYAHTGSHCQTPARHYPGCPIH